MASKQQRYQQRHKEAGLCSRCPRPAYLGGSQYRECREKQTARLRWQGMRPRAVAKTGRPTLEVAARRPWKGPRRYRSGALKPGPPTLRVLQARVRLLTLALALQSQGRV